MEWASWICDIHCMWKPTCYNVAQFEAHVLEFYNSCCHFLLQSTDAHDVLGLQYCSLFNCCFFFCRNSFVKGCTFNDRDRVTFHFFCRRTWSIVISRTIYVIISWPAFAGGKPGVTTMCGDHSVQTDWAIPQVTGSGWISALYQPSLGTAPYGTSPCVRDR